MADVVPALPVVACNECQAPIVWAFTVLGKRMPLDATATVNGNVYLTWAPDTRTWHAIVRTRSEARSPAWAEVPQHVHHAMTCPHAARWNPGAAKARGAKPDTPGAPSRLTHVVFPGNVRPIQEGMF